MTLCWLEGAGLLGPSTRGIGVRHRPFYFNAEAVAEIINFETDLRGNGELSSALRYVAKKLIAGSTQPGYVPYPEKEGF